MSILQQDDFTDAVSPAPTEHMDEICATAERFVAALATKDFAELEAALNPDVRLRYLIPPGPDEVRGAAEVAAKFRLWFGDCDVIEVQDVWIEPLPGRASARYRFKVNRQTRWEVIEQQTYVDVDDEGRIAAIDLLCSGFRGMTIGNPIRHSAEPMGIPIRHSAEPIVEEGPSSRTHHFDAGTLGCADGLAGEFRNRISAIPLGDVLVIETSDPAAKEDLPPLARMMGHTVRSVEPDGNGRLVITVERGQR